MKVIFCSDFHHDLVVGGYDVRDDLLRVQDQIVDASLSAGLVVIGGDLFHRPNPSPRAYADIISFLNGIECPVLVIPGNHDVGHSGDALAPLRAIHFPDEDGDAFDFWSVAEESCVWESRVFIADLPGLVEFRGRQFLIAGHVSDVLASELSNGAMNGQDLIDAAFRQGLKRGRLSAAFAHLNVDGVKADSEGEFLRGGTLNMPLCQARNLGCPVVNGHIHRKQRFEDWLYIPGSVVRTRFVKTRGSSRYVELHL